MTVRERKNSANSDSASAARRQPERIGYASAAPPGYIIIRSYRRLRAVILDAIGCLPAVALTFVLTLPLFAPWSIWPLGYVAFVPWLVMVCRAERTGGAYLSSYMLGLAFFLAHWRWLLITTPPGYFAGCIAFALYFVLTAWLVRHLRLARAIPVTFAFPIVWTLVEVMRSRGVLAFPWFLLGHSQIRLLSLVQIADITGVYGVSFALAMVNGLCADLILRRAQRRAQVGWARPTSAHDSAPAREGGQCPPYGSAESPHDGAHARGRGQCPPCRMWPAAPISVVMVFALVVGYGWWRLTTLPIQAGPSVAVLQGDYLLSADENISNTEWYRRESVKQKTYLDMLSVATKQRPDLLVLPETPWSMYMNPQLPPGLRPWYDRFANLADRHQSTIVVGAMSQEKPPPGIVAAEKKYNSAFVFRPDGRDAGRYDKMHLVLLGEYVPFRYSLPAVYRWINGITPWGAGGYDYSLTPGEEPRVFSMAERETSASHRFGVTICYEDVIPQVFRRFVVDAGGKRVDFMLNISNDGWFGHGAQQAQHLVNCAFRAIENRVGVARSVNTGVSGFIRPDGSWHDLVETAPDWPKAGGTGYKVARIDGSPVVTFYSRFGDVFGVAVAGLGCLVAIDAIFARWRQRRTGRSQQHVTST